jgi:hypothetical protein
VRKTGSADAGPLAALPALLFFVCILAFYPQIGAEAHTAVRLALYVLPLFTIGVWRMRKLSAQRLKTP